MSGSDSGGISKVPISNTVLNNGTVTYQNVSCTDYEMQIGSSDGAAHNGVNLSAPSGCYLSPGSVDVPATGTVNAHCYVPTSNNGAVSVTVTESGYLSNSIQVQSG